MYGEDVPVVGEERPPSRPPPPPHPGGWLALLVVIGTVAVVLATGGLADQSPVTEAETLPLLPPPTTTEAPVEPPNDAVLIDATLTWEEARGLHSAHSIAEVVRFAGGWYAIGEDSSGPALWSSDDGSVWEVTSRPGPGRGATVTDAAVVGDTIVAVGTDEAGQGVVHVTGDGIGWEVHLMPDDDPLTRAVPQSVVAGAEGLLVYGHTQPDLTHLLEDPPAALPGTLARGQAWIDAEGVVMVNPGIRIAEIDPARVPEVESLTAVWTGPPHALGLAGTPTAVAAFSVEPAPWGGFVGIGFVPPDQRLITSVDGIEWAGLPGEVGRTGRGSRTWRDGIIGVSDDFSVVSTDPRTGEVSVLSPELLLTRAGGQLTGMETGGAGIVVTLAEGSVVLRGTMLLVTRQDGIDLRLGRTFEMEISDEDRVWTAGWTSWTEQARFDGETLTFVIDDSPPVMVPLDEWVRAFESLHATTSHPGDTRIVHSPDGRRWSVTEWQDLGDGTATHPSGEVATFVTHDFVLVVDQGTGAWLGRPLTD